MARPKKEEKKVRVNLTLDKDDLEKGQETAKHLKKSLSEFTGYMYQDLHDNFFGLDKNPEEMLKYFKKQIEKMENIYKNKLNNQNKSKEEDSEEKS